MKTARLQYFLKCIILVLSIALINQLCNKIPFRIDLTEEGRYTLTDPTVQLLEELDEEVFFEIYLAGDLPSNFERFRKSIEEMLLQFVVVSDNRVGFRFTDPGQATGSKARNQFYQSLIEKGIEPTNLTYKDADGDQMQKLLFPGGTVSMNMIELPVNLLKGNRSEGSELQLNQAIEGLEFQLASAIAQVQGAGSRKRIGYVKGHGSPDSLEIAGFKNTVLSRFDLFELNLKGRKELVGYDAVVVAKPSQPFSEAEKYLLDQYLMKGGNLLFFIDALSVNLDSVFGEGTVAIPRELNLTDMLFKYGVRINQNYVLDVNSGQFPIVTGNIGDQPQIQMIPWPFDPVITNFSDHPSVRNLDAVRGQFVSEVDTVRAVGVQKTPLMSTSKYTKVLSPPVRVAFNDLRDKLRPDFFTQGPKTIGYLLEGSFSSLYANRLIPAQFEKAAFLEKGEIGKVVVVGDGDLIRNEVDPKTGEPLSLGVEPFSGITYADEDFIINILDYLTDDNGLIAARSREVKIRPLDRVKIQRGRTKYQVINVVLPILIVLVLGLLKWYLRKSKYAK
ncbi:MAG: gliding motility-associated ABC transporter substrate-binding protein GldG [Bacteroidota bacterium]